MKMTRLNYNRQEPPQRLAKSVLLVHYSSLIKNVITAPE